MRETGTVLNVLSRLAFTPGGGSNTKMRPARNRFTGTYTRFENNRYNNNNKVNLYSAITMQIYSIALLEKSSMLGQCQIIYQVMYNEIIDTYV